MERAEDVGAGTRQVIQLRPGRCGTKQLVAPRAEVGRLLDQRGNLCLRTISKSRSRIPQHVAPLSVGRGEATQWSEANRLFRRHRVLHAELQRQDHSPPKRRPLEDSERELSSMALERSAQGDPKLSPHLESCSTQDALQDE